MFRELMTGVAAFTLILAVADRAPAMETAPSMEELARGEADIINTAGDSVGHATLTQVEEGVQIDLTVALPIGVHGFHIHETGKCDTPDFKSAGGHFNPQGHEHGMDNPAGHHAGDLPNITVESEEVLSWNVLAKGLTLVGGDHPILDDDGAALMVHESADDYKSNPSGNAGARIACGVILEVAP